MIGPARFDLRRLCFEITETAVITRLDEARRLVDALRAHRIKVALDDLGSGASWFSYLKSFPVDCVKIGGPFTRDLLHDPLNRVALRCFGELAASVGADTIVAFVEHDLQRDALPTLGFEPRPGRPAAQAGASRHAGGRRPGSRLSPKPTSFRRRRAGLPSWPTMRDRRGPVGSPDSVQVDQTGFPSASPQRFRYVHAT